MNVIYSIGHGTKSTDLLISQLQEANIEMVVDVRSVPYSKYNPQHNREALQSSLKMQGIDYMYRGKSLGGRGGNILREETLDEVTNLVRNGKKVAVMCSETNPRQCHRAMYGEDGIRLQPDFEARNLSMQHIGLSSSQEPSSQSKLF